MQSDSTALTLQSAKDIRKAWELFVTGDDRFLEKVRPEIRASWQRSRQAGINPALHKVPTVLGQEEVERKRGQNSSLLEAGQEIIPRLSQEFSTEKTFIIGITDGDVNMLYAYSPPHDHDKREAMNVLPGAVVRESSIGTCSAGTALYLNKPVQVYWYEHYVEFMQSWAGCAAPIRSACGNTIGGLAATAYREIAHPRALDLLTAAAKSIEKRVRAIEETAYFKVLDEFNRYLLKFPDSLLLALCPHEHILALSPAMAKLIPGRPSDRLIGRSLHDVRDFQLEGFLSSIDNPSTPYESTILLPQKDKIRSATVIPIFKDGRKAGAVIVAPDLGQLPHRKVTKPSWQAVHTFHNLIGRSEVFSHALQLAQKAADHDWPVLLVGESGTGKELFAQAIHRASRRAPGPFVAVNCSTIPKELAASELFGYEEGAFSGALRGGQPGKIELAHRGTLFLDEVADIPSEIQPSLLRILEEGVVVPLASRHPRAVDIRVIAALNTDPSAAVAQGKLRLDLYHRLNVFPIFLPPLRKRVADLPLLIRHILDREGFANAEVSPEVLELFRMHSWPGNIRELRNVLVRAVMLSPNQLITRQHLPQEILIPQPSIAPSPTISPWLDREGICRALQQCRGNKSHAAKLLGVHWVTLHRKMRQYGLTHELVAEGTEDNRGERRHQKPHHLKVLGADNSRDAHPIFKIGDLSPLIIRALLQYTKTSISSISSIRSQRKYWFIETAEITRVARLIAQEEANINPERITSKRVGRVLARLHLKRAPDTSTRAWLVGPPELEQLATFLLSLTPCT